MSDGDVSMKDALPEPAAAAIESRAAGDSTANANGETEGRRPRNASGSGKKNNRFNRGKKKKGNGAGGAEQNRDGAEENSDALGEKRKRDEEGKSESGPARKKGREDKRPPRVWEARELPEGEEKEERKPKRKVAVYMGYTGTGYKGMQLNPPLKTIEGDLFDAFVRAGAISKANSDDPKKSSLARCARTDKGVHAAGNLISLKLIIEDENIVDKINAELPPTIRIWGIQRTVGSFNCYAQCDSRRYEYLIPTHSFLPPHPTSFLAKEVEKWLEIEGKRDEWARNQGQDANWWANTNEKAKKELGEDVVQKALETLSNHASARGSESKENDAEEDSSAEMLFDKEGEAAKPPTDPLKLLKAFYLKEKKAYRIPQERLQRIREALQMYCGTNNFWNFTINKKFGDPSAKRYIKTFIALDPIIVEGTEWIQMRVHGQSFMMHQIRKMVGLVLMSLRMGANLDIIKQAYTNQALPIPKAPGIGLFLERPVFETYNKKAPTHGREEISFDKYNDQIEQFKKEHIFTTMYEEERKSNVFNNFVNFIDYYRDPAFLYLTAGGMRAVEECKKAVGTNRTHSSVMQELAGSDSEDNGEEEG